MKRRAFTLVELLVVISIIALLLSILMPALNKVREQAKTLVCATRMSQWGQYLFLYANDNQDNIPYLIYTSTAGGYHGDRWYDKLGKYISDKNSTASEADDGLGENYYLKLRECPATTKNNPVYTGVNSSSWPKISPFGPEYTQTTSLINSPTKLTTIRQPGSLFCFLDVIAWFLYSPMYPYYFDTDRDGDGMVDTNSKLYLYNGAQPRVHSDGANLWMFDGHREYIKFKVFWESDIVGKPVHQFWKFKPGRRN